ncbi:MAG: ccoO [Cyanobacteria bacterium RYN_339]|nr:ccoO [Cyanobacteria bacterium RYN_339]
MQPDHHPHQWIERRPFWFVAAVTVAVSIGGLVEMIPLFKLSQGGQPSSLEAKAAALVRPRGALAMEGFDVYVREGCYTCHSQMVRPFRHETQRYGNYSLAADAQYDHPFQYGSRRIGPDLARLGGKYPDSWHYQHLKEPASMVPGSLMPRYTWLEQTKLDPQLTQAKLRAQRVVGVPYTDAEIADAPKAVLDKNEADALVAYLQSLGTATKDLAQEETAHVVRR